LCQSSCPSPERSPPGSAHRFARPARRLPIVRPSSASCAHAGGAAAISTTATIMNPPAIACRPIQSPRRCRISLRPGLEKKVCPQGIHPIYTFHRYRFFSESSRYRKVARSVNRKKSATNDQVRGPHAFGKPARPRSLGFRSLGVGLHSSRLRRRAC
jgi:hypothetical protein